MMRRATGIPLPLVHIVPMDGNRRIGEKREGVIDIDSFDFEKFRRFLPVNISMEQLEFCRQAFHEIANNRDTTKVSVIAERCGIGKSMLIRAFIQYILSPVFINGRETPLGLIVITDSIRRLEGLTKIEQQVSNSAEWEALVHRLEQQVGILKSGGEPIATQMTRQEYRPILLMSTQRYFMLDADTREQLFHFRYDDRIVERNLILFDERPYFYENVTITDDTLCDIEKTLRTMLSNDVKEKDFVTAGYENYKKYLQTVMTDRERINKTKDLYLYWKDDLRSTITTDDTVFFKAIEDNAPMLRKKYFNIMRDLRSLQELAQNGAILNSRKKRTNAEYELSFHLVHDNRDCFYLGQNRKFFIMDATADVDPAYDVDYIEFADIKKAMTSVALKIVSVNVNTSKGNMQQMRRRGDKRERMSEVISKYITDRISQHDDVLVITFKDDTDLYSHFNGVGYFGNIKGFNDFKDYTNLAHVGLNRFPDTEYLYLYYGTHPDEYRKLALMSEEESMKILNDVLVNRKDHNRFTDIVRDIARKTILTDFEQNIFRVKIRLTIKSQA